MSDTRWLIFANGKEHGPTDAVTLRRLAAEGKISPYTIVRRMRRGPWFAASELKGLFHSAETAATGRAKVASVRRKKNARRLVADPPPNEDDVMNWISNSEDIS